MLAVPLDRRRLRIIGAAAGAAAAGWTTWWLHWFAQIDLQVYRLGASAVLHGRDLYRVALPGSGLPFTYPPFAALVFTPLAALPDVAARVLMSAASAVALVVIVRVALGAAGARRGWTLLVTALAVVALEPVRDTFRFGQVNLVLAALVMVDLVWRHGTPRRGRGALVGLAAAVKLTPAIFILYLVVSRRLREAATACGVALAATGLALVVSPVASRRYWGRLVLDDRRIGSVGFVWNQSLRGATARIAGSPHAGLAVWMALAVVAVVIGMGLAARAAAAGDELLGVVLAAVTGLLVSPISWDHHWVWAVPAAIWLGRRMPRAAVGGVAVFVLAPIGWWAFPHGSEYHLALTAMPVTDAYVVAGVAFAALAAWSLAGRSDTAARVYPTARRT